jgi:hypothetical protein
MTDTNSNSPLQTFLNTVLEDLPFQEKQEMQTLFEGMLGGIEQQAMTPFTPGYQPVTELPPPQQLAHYIEKACEVVENLAHTPFAGDHLNLIRRIELQLSAIAISIGDLKDIRFSQQALPEHKKGLKIFLKSLLLKEFDFINSWLR